MRPMDANPWKRWRMQAVQLDRLARWREKGGLDVDAWQRARALLAEDHAGPPWRDVLERLSLWLAVVLLGAAAICFIAANWDALDRFTRLAGLQAVLAAAAVAASRLGLERGAGQAALLLAGLLLGGLLALVGQTWQTGADTWQLFAAWAGLLLPWLLLAAHPGMSLLWATVANLALWLFLDERLSAMDLLWLLLALFNLALAGVWETAGRRLPALSGRTGPRMLLVSALFALTCGGMLGVMDPGPTSGTVVPACLLLSVAVAAWARHRRDLPLLAVAALALVATLTTLLGRLFLVALDLGAFGFLLLTLAVLAQVAFASRSLLHLSRTWKHG